MCNLNIFIADSVTFRSSSMFEADVKVNIENLTQEIEDKSVFKSKDVENENCCSGK